MFRSTIERARRQEYGETIEIKWSGPFQPPRDFEQSTFPQSMPKGAEAVYREDRPRDSIQIRVYDDRITLQLDEYNPEYHPLQHAIHDATEYTAAAVFAVAVGAAVSG